MPEPLAQILVIMLISISIIITTAALLAVVAAIVPVATVASSRRVVERPWLAPLLGLLVSLPWIVASFIIMQLSSGLAWVGLGVVIIWITMMLIGLVGPALALGSRWAGGPDNQKQSNVRNAWVGGLLLGTAAALPVIGWLLVLPTLGMVGIGSFILAMVPAKNRSVVAGPADSQRDDKNEAFQLCTFDSAAS